MADETVRIPAPGTTNELSNMSDEEVRTLYEMAQSRLGSQPETQQFQMRLPDGRQVTGNQAEIQAQVDTIQQQAPEPQAQQNPHAAPEWADAEFNRLHSEKGVKEALDYYLRDAFQGQNPAEVLGMYGQALANVGSQVLDFNKERFNTSHPGVPENGYESAIQFCQQNNWPAVGQNLERAYVLLKHEGTITEQAPQPQAGPQLAPGPAPADYSQRGQGQSLPEATQQFIPQRLTPQAEGNWNEVPNDVGAIESATQHMGTDELRAYIDKTLNQGGSIQ